MCQETAQSTRCPGFIDVVLKGSRTYIKPGEDSGCPVRTLRTRLELKTNNETSEQNNFLLNSLFNIFQMSSLQ